LSINGRIHIEELKIFSKKVWTIKKEIRNIKYNRNMIASALRNIVNGQIIRVCDVLNGVYDQTETFFENTWQLV